MAKAAPAAAREMVEGPEASRRFKDAMAQIASVGKDELKRREAAWRRKRAETRKRQQ